MLTSAPSAKHDRKLDRKPGRARALAAAGGVTAASVVWFAEVPLIGIHLRIRFGSGGSLQTIGIGQIIGVSLAAALLGWLLLAVLERRTSHARAVWTSAALVALVASLGLPLHAATTTSATVGLIVMHVAVAAIVIPGLAATSRAR